MYSYEDRIRAVKLYIKLGKRLSSTIRQLGYPTKNSLIGWYREYEQSQDLRIGYSRTGQKYSDQQKHAAVKHYLRIPLMADSDSIPIADSVPGDGGHVARVS